MNPLHLTVENTIGIQDMAGCRFDPRRELQLSRTLRLAKCLPKGLVLRKGLEFAELTEIADPAIADCVPYSARQCWIRQ